MHTGGGGGGGIVLLYFTGNLETKIKGKSGILRDKTKNDKLRYIQQ